MRFRIVDFGLRIRNNSGLAPRIRNPQSPIRNSPFLSVVRHDDSYLWVLL